MHVQAMAPLAECAFSMQATHAVLSNAYVSEGQSMQALSSEPFCIVPALHATHVLPLLKYPATHRHSEMESDPSGDDEKSKHDRHVLILVAAWASEKVFAGQGISTQRANLAGILPSRCRILPYEMPRAVSGAAERCVCAHSTWMVM